MFEGYGSYIRERDDDRIPTAQGTREPNGADKFHQ